MKLKENFIFSILKWIKNINEKHEEKQDSRNEEVRLNRKKEREGGKWKLHQILQQLPICAKKAVEIGEI